MTASALGTSLRKETHEGHHWVSCDNICDSIDIPSTIPNSSNVQWQVASGNYLRSPALWTFVHAGPFGAQGLSMTS